MPHDTDKSTSPGSPEQGYRHRQPYGITALHVRFGDFRSDSILSASLTTRPVRPRPGTEVGARVLDSINLV
jgi:hypothetical protein